MTGYTCDVSAGTCTRSNTPLQEISAVLVGGVECDDGSECPTGTTCCKLASGQWGCCPYPSAVCCSDGEHCCPEGKLFKDLRSFELMTVLSSSRLFEYLIL